MTIIDADGKDRRVTLVLPVRNEAGNVEDTLGSLFEGTMLPDEILVPDGRSTDTTVAEIEDFAARHPAVEIRIIDNEKLWVGPARNRAIENSTGDIILIADFGNRFRPNWVEAMVKPFLDDPETDIVCGLFQPKVETDFQHCVAVVHMLEEYMLHRIPREVLPTLLPEVVVPVGMATGLTRDAFDRVGNFPEWLFKGQDKLFGRKAWALGLKIVVAWEALVDHHVRATPAEVFDYQYYYGRGFGQQRLLSNMTRKLAVVYLALLGLLISGFFWAPLWIGAALLAGLHLWHFGFRRQMRQTIRPWKWSYLYLIPVALVSRDLGSIAGHAVGWIHWLTRPDLRRLHETYLAGVDPSRLRFVSK